jgi:endonuclease YncB( thermonuclease family)
MKMQFEYKYCELVRIIDGDSIECLIDMGFEITKKVIVRLDGLNAPEINTHEGKECRKNLVVKLAKYIPIHGSYFKKYFTLIVKKYDKYGRSLAEVIIDNNENINEWSLKENNCVPYHGEKREEKIIAPKSSGGL